MKKLILIILATIILVFILLSIYPLSYIYTKNYGVKLKPNSDIPVKQVEYFMQNDKNWANEKLGNTSETLGGYGCLVTSITTALNYYGKDFTPKNVNELFKIGVLNESGLVVWMNIKNVIPDIDYEYDRVFTSRKIEKLLLKDMLPIVEVKYKGFGVKHWCVVIGAENGEFILMDPLSNDKVKLSEHGGRVYSYRVLVKTEDTFFNKPESFNKSNIKVYKKERELELYCDDILVGLFKIGLGGSPLGDKNKEGDHKTPVGSYYICTRVTKTNYTRFLGLSYPNIEDANRNRDSISQKEYSEIEKNIKKLELPPWNTPLGGAVGIHGGGDKKDWTAGCIAVSNDAIKQIWDLTDYKTPVEIFESR